MIEIKNILEVVRDLVWRVRAVRVEGRWVCLYQSNTRNPCGLELCSILVAVVDT